MIIEYSPDGKDKQKWTWDPDEVLAAEAMAIEKRAGCNWSEFRQHVLNGSIVHRQVLLWHLLKHDHPNLKLVDVRFRAGELTVEQDVSELRELRDKVAKSDTMDDTLRSRALDQIDQEIADQEFDAVTSPEGKAPSQTDTSAIG